MNTRKLSFLGLLIVAVTLATSYYLEAYSGLIPCALCMLQRYTMIGLGLFLFIGSAYKFEKTGNIILSIPTALMAIFGLILAGRQVWLQHLPLDKTSSCIGNLEYMLKVLPINKVIENIFSGSSECSAVGWRFLHLSLAEWSCICFGILLILALWQRVLAASSRNI